MQPLTFVAIGLAIASTTLTNLAYAREHDAATELPPLSLRHPIASLRLLLADRGWLSGFGMEASGFACYAGAVGLGSLALVQSIGAGGIGLLALVTSRMRGLRLSRRHIGGVVLSMMGLAALGISLTRDSGPGGRGDTFAIILWIAAIAGAAALIVLAGRARGSAATAEGLAGGLLFSIGDLSTKIATQGGARAAFVVTLVAGYAMGTSLLQLGYQRGGTLTVAGLATLLTNAVPIVAGTVLLGEQIPSGVLGVLRVGSFCLVIAGSILLTGHDRPSARERSRDASHRRTERSGSLAEASKAT